MSDIGAQPGEPIDEEKMRNLLWPTVLELQQVLVDRLHRPIGGPDVGAAVSPDVVAAISVTSCNSYSCR